MTQKRINWSGVFVVSATPFTEEGDVDSAAFRGLLKTFRDDGVHGVVVAGSTGEWYTLTNSERIELFEIARAELGSEIKLIAGTSAIATRDAVALTRAAAEAGADGAMVLAPPYAHPNEAEVINHFKAVGEIGLPLMIYNNPGRTQVNLTAPVIEKLLAIESVVALKESSKDLYQISTTLSAVGERLAVFSGLEPYALPSIQRGAVGIVSMSANFVGSVAVDFYEHACAQRWREAAELEQLMDRLYEMFYATDHGAYVVIKECMNLVGRPGGWPRLPHLRMNEKQREALKRVLKDAGVNL